MKQRYNPSVWVFVLVFASCGLRPIIIPEPTARPEDELYQQAEELFGSESYDEALGAYEAFMDRYPQHHSAPDALMRIGMIHQREELADRAEATYRRVIRQYPDSLRIPDAYLAILGIHYRAGRFSDLIRQSADVLPILDSGPQFLQFYRLIGDTYAAAESWAGAAESYAKAYPYGSLEERAALGRKLTFASKHLDPAEILSLYNRVEEGEARGYLLYQLGKNHAAADDIAKALERLTEFVENYPRHEMVFEAKQLLRDITKASAYQQHVIGCLLPLTGRYGSIGRQALMGIELALSRRRAAPGRSPITVLIKDTESNPAKALKCVGELADAQVSAILGPIISAEGAIRRAQQEKIPIVALTQKQGVTALGDYVFRNFITPKMQAEAIVSHATEVLGLETFAILYPDEPYGKTFMNQIWDSILYHRGRVVGVESYDPALTDFADPIKKLIGLHYEIPDDLRDNDYRFIHVDESLIYFDPVLTEALKALLELADHTERTEETPMPVLDWVEEAPETELAPIVDFEAIVIPDASRTAGLIVPQLAFFDIENVYLFGTNLWHSDSLIEMAGDYVQGAILPSGFFAGSQSEHVAEFTDLFGEAFHQSPTFIEAIAYDTARILFGVSETPGIRFRQEFRDQMLTLRDFPGVTGLSSCSETGDIQKQLYLLRIKGKRFVEVTP